MLLDLNKVQFIRGASRLVWWCNGSTAGEGMESDYGEDLFGRDSDSEKDVAPSTDENAAPTGGGAAGGFLGQVENIVAKPDAGSGSGGEGTAPSTEGKARGGERGDVDKEDSPPPPSQGGAQPKKTIPRPVYDGNRRVHFSKGSPGRAACSIQRAWRCYASRNAFALCMMLLDSGAAYEDIHDTWKEPDIAKVRELLDTGMDVRYQVRVSLCI